MAVVTLVIRVVFKRGPAFIVIYIIGYKYEAISNYAP